MKVVSAVRCGLASNHRRRRRVIGHRKAYPPRRAGSLQGSRSCSQTRPSLESARAWRTWPRRTGEPRKAQLQTCRKQLPSSPSGSRGCSPTTTAASTCHRKILSRPYADHRQKRAHTPSASGVVERFNGRIVRKMLGITIYARQELEQPLRGRNAASKD
jgi:hypothetical protein